MKIDDWEELPLHEMCSLFPEMNEEQYESLVIDIKRNGLHDAIIVYEEVMDDTTIRLFILDGQNRRMACVDARVEPHFEHYKGDDPLSYVISKNVGRRHLTTGQLAALAAGVANMENGDNQFTHDGEVISIEKAASLFGTSAKSVQRFRMIQETDPKVAQEVARGNETLNVAYKEVKVAKAAPALSETGPIVPLQESTSEGDEMPTRDAGPDRVEQPREDTGDAPAGPTQESIDRNKKMMENGKPIFKLNDAQFARLKSGEYTEITSDTGWTIRLIREN